MNKAWDDRNTIVAHLFNPAFCGEIIRVTAFSYNRHTNKQFPFAFSYLVLPILLHKDTRNKMPRSVRTYFFAWIGENDALFFDFEKRTRSMVKYTKEALSFLIAYKKIELSERGEILTTSERPKLINRDNYEEYNEIIKKAEMLGKWLATTSDVKSIYSFLRITP